MVLRNKIIGVNKIMHVDNHLFVRAANFPSDVEACFVSEEYNLFSSEQTAFRYLESRLEVFNKSDNCFVVISNDSNDMLQSITDKNMFLFFSLSTDCVEVYNFENRIVENKFSFDKDISLFYNNSIVITEGISYTRKNKISNYNLKDLLCTWHYTLPEGFKIFGPVQAIDNVLFFISMKGTRYQLVTGLDLETGKVLWQNEYEITTSNNFIVAEKLNKSDGLLYGLGSVYQILNPKTGEILLQKEIEEKKKANFVLDRFSVYDNKLWFVGEKYDKCKFGYINIETNELELFQSFKQENDEVFEAPIYHNGKLYLRGKFHNNLYVFE